MVSKLRVLNSHSPKNVILMLQLQTKLQMLKIEWNYLVNQLVLDSTLSRLLHTEGRRNSSLSIACGL